MRNYVMLALGYISKVQAMYTVFLIMKSIMASSSK